MTAIPAYTRTWTQNLTGGVPGTRIPWVSAINTLQSYVYGVKSFLVAGGCSVVWSASAGVGPANSADHTDRITSAATWTPRATVDAASQAWVILLDGNGGQLLISFKGGSDVHSWISYSPGALFALAGTTNNRPTAPDEMTLNNDLNDLVSGVAADSVWHGLISADAKAYRFTIMSNGNIVGQTWYVENFTPAIFGVNTALAHPVYVGAIIPGYVTDRSNFFQNFSQSNVGCQVSISVSSVRYSAALGFFGWFCNQVVPSTLQVQAELQGGYLPFPVVIYSTLTAGARGAMGTPIDFWVAGPTAYAVGDGFGGACEWWQCGIWLWPNPSLQPPTLA